MVNLSVQQYLHKTTPKLPIWCLCGVPSSLMYIKCNPPTTHDHVVTVRLTHGDAEIHFFFKIYATMSWVNYIAIILEIWNWGIGHWHYHCNALDFAYITYPGFSMLDIYVIITLSFLIFIAWCISRVSVWCTDLENIHPSLKKQRLIMIG